MISTLAKPSDRQAQILHAHATHYMAKPDGVELGQIAHLITEKKVRPHVEAQLPLEEAARAQSMLEKEHPRGKVVLEVRPS